MPRVGYEPMTPAFERAKAVYVLDRVSTVFGLATCINYKFPQYEISYIAFLINEAHLFKNMYFPHHCVFTTRKLSLAPQALWTGRGDEQ
jgi:hypothetical protein